MEETLGKRICAHRKRLGLTQDSMAEKLGVTAQAVSKWENDQSCPDISMLPKLSELFGCSTDALLGLETPVSLPENVLPAPENPEAEPEGIHFKKNNWEFRWDGGRRGRLAPALWVLLFGLYLSAGAVLDWDTPFWTGAFYSGLTVFGLLGLYPRFSLFRLCCGLLGIYSLLKGTGLLPFLLPDDLLLPLALVFLGLHLLIKALGHSEGPSAYFSLSDGVHSQNSCTCEGEAFQCTGSFGENDHLITLSRLSRGSAALSFGEMELDLSGCEEIADGCRLDLSCSFGDLRLKIPRGCRVEPSISTAFGDVTVAGTPAADAATVIYVNGKASFGQITILYL